MSNSSPLIVIRRNWHVVKNGTLNQLAELIDELRPFLRPLASALIPDRLRAKADESDVAQHTAERATVAIMQFRGETPEEFWAWLIAIQRNQVNHLIERYRAAKRSVARERTLADDANIPDPHQAQEEIEERELRERREFVLLSLRPDDRQVIRLRMEEQLDFAEIARRMDREKEAVKKLYARALGRWLNACKEFEEEMS